MQTARVEIRFALPKPARGIAVKRDGAPTKKALPRISRLMALAIELQRRLNLDEFDYAELAQLGRISRPRLTQIFNLLNLAPDLQEELLFLEPADCGRERLTEKTLRRLSGIWAWDEQRRAFKAIHAAPVQPSRKRSEPQ